MTLSDASFEISRQWTGHQLDVRAVCAVPSLNAVATGSRDQSVKLWSIGNPSEPLLANLPKAHQHFVTCCHFLGSVSDTLFPQGALVTAGSDKQILVWDLQAVVANGISVENDHHATAHVEPVLTLLGHTDTISDLSIYRPPATNGVESPLFWIYSSSWDKTVRMWTADGQCRRVLKGHTLAVWAVLALSEDAVLTAAADKTIKLWQGEQCVHTFTDHTDVVRSLAQIDNDRFVSCSNDGSLRIWSLGSKTCLQTLYGHTSFVYSVCVLRQPGDSSYQLVSSGEDSSVRIWKEGQCIQTLLHPAISIWSVCALDNGDIVSGASDHIVRVFTRSPDRRAPDAEREAYQQAVESRTVAAQTMGGVDSNQVKDASALQRPGKDQQVIMVRTPQNSVEAHQYSAAQGQWIKLGEVVSAVQNKQKQIYQGVEWDYVFDVELQAGEYLKLPYNSNENPYTAAQRFIDANELSQDFLEQIAQFLIRNTEGVNVGGPGVQNGVSGFQNQDPLTGSKQSQPASSTKVIPMKDEEWLSFGGGNTAGMQKAIVENGKNSGSVVDATVLESILKSSASQKLSDSAVTLLRKLLLEWSGQLRFPAIDLLRYLVADRGARADQLSSAFTVAELLKTGFLSGYSQDELKALPAKTQDIIRMLTLKVLTNLLAFAPVAVKQAVADSLNSIDIKTIVARESSANLKLSAATLLLNQSLFIGRKQQSSFAKPLLEAQQHLLANIADSTEEEALFRTVIGQAHLLHYFRNHLSRPDTWCVTIVRVNELGSQRARVLAAELQTL